MTENYSFTEWAGVFVFLHIGLMWLWIHFKGNDMKRIEEMPFLLRFPIVICGEVCHLILDIGRRRNGTYKYDEDDSMAGEEAAEQNATVYHDAKEEESN